MDAATLFIALVATLNPNPAPLDLAPPYVAPSRDHRLARVAKTEARERARRGVREWRAEQRRIAREKAERKAAREAARAAAARAAQSTASYGGGVERWRGLALEVGWSEAELPTLLRIIRAESGGNPRAFNASSRCSGLLQLHPCWWDGRWSFDPFDPRLNLAYGLKVKRLSGWSAWVTY
jgi:hypothetical protein